MSSANATAAGLESSSVAQQPCIGAKLPFVLLTASYGRNRGNSPKIHLALDFPIDNPPLFVPSRSRSLSLYGATPFISLSPKHIYVCCIAIRYSLKRRKTKQVNLGSDARMEAMMDQERNIYSYRTLAYHVIFLVKKRHERRLTEQY